MKSREQIMKANRAKLATKQTSQGFAVNTGYPMDNPLYGKEKVAQKSRKTVKSDK